VSGGFKMSLKIRQVDSFIHLQKAIYCGVKQREVDEIPNTDTLFTIIAPPQQTISLPNGPVSSSSSSSSLMGTSSLVLPASQSSAVIFMALNQTEIIDLLEIEKRINQTIPNLSDDFQLLDITLRDDFCYRLEVELKYQPYTVGVRTRKRKTVTLDLEEEEEKERGSKEYKIMESNANASETCSKRVFEKEEVRPLSKRVCHSCSTNTTNSNSSDNVKGVFDHLMDANGNWLFPHHKYKELENLLLPRDCIDDFARTLSRLNLLFDLDTPLTIRLEAFIRMPYLVVQITGIPCIRLGQWKKIYRFIQDQKAYREVLMNFIAEKDRNRIEVKVRPLNSLFD
jgi:hypothetical protein